MCRVGISRWNVPSPSGARLEPCQPKHSLCSSSSSRQMGWELLPLKYSRGMDNFSAVVPELWQFQPDVSDSLCDTCRVWQAPARSLGRKIKVSPPLPLKTTSLGFPESGSVTEHTLCPCLARGISSGKVPWIPDGAGGQG